MKQNKNKFIFHQNSFNYKNIILLFSIIISFITVLFISIYNNGLSFITSNNIAIETLLETLVGFSVGCSLAASGAAMRPATRNASAGPSTLGFLPAASFGIIIYRIMDFPSVPWVILCAYMVEFLNKNNLNVINDDPSLI